MELHQVRYFVALCKSLSFTRAAQACQVTQPALTRGIQRLEEELGGALFRRERNLTQLTELGRLMQTYLEQMLAMAEAATENASRFSKNELAVLRIGLPQTLSPELATRSLSEVVRRIPLLEVKLLSDAQSHVISRLMEGELDTAFLVDDGQFPKRLNKWLLYSEAFQLAFGPMHALAQYKDVALRVLQAHALIACTDCPGLAELKKQCEAMGVAIKAPFSVDGYEQAQYIANTGLGVAILPERLPLLPQLASRHLVDVQLSRAVVIAVVGGRRFSPALSAFVKLVRARDFTVETRI